MESEDLINLSRLGENISPDITNTCTKFISRLYDKQRKFSSIHDNINEMRVKLATTKQSSVQNLPPSNPALVQHLKRCYWQAHYWYNAHMTMVTEINPINSGWKLENEKLQAVYFEGPSSLELLQKYFCNCRSKKNSCNSKESCTCHAANIKCCQLCKCKAECFLQPVEDE